MEKIHLYDKILSPLLTEKSTNLSEQNKIVFKVHKKANKKNLKNNIEKIFKFMLKYTFGIIPGYFRDISRIFQG